jgi:FkbM family methyltransferase
MKAVQTMARRLLRVVLYPVILLRRRYLGRFSRFYDSLFAMVEGGSAVVRIPAFQGSFEIDLHSHILKRVLMEKQFEPEIVEIAGRYVDSTKDVLDIGANVGLFTVLFAKTICESSRVLAVEPTTQALKYLRGNIERNGCSQSVVVFEGVAADTQGDFQIHVIPGLSEYTSVGQLVHHSVQKMPAEKIVVQGDTVDKLVDAFNLRPGFVKIDVEGAEYLVLRGAMQTLKEFQPVIFAELSEKMLASCGATPEMVISLLQHSGYRIVPVGDGVLALPTNRD